MIQGNHNAFPASFRHLLCGILSRARQGRRFVAGFNIGDIDGSAGFTRTKQKMINLFFKTGFRASDVARIRLYRIRATSYFNCKRRIRDRFASFRYDQRWLYLTLCGGWATKRFKSSYLHLLCFVV